MSCFGSRFLTSQGALLGPRWATEAPFWDPQGAPKGPKAPPKAPRPPKQPSTAKTRLQPAKNLPRPCQEPAKNLPRTCQEPAGQRLYPRTFLGYTGSVAPTRSQIARCQDQGAAVARPLAVFNESICYFHELITAHRSSPLFRRARGPCRLFSGRV